MSLVVKACPVLDELVTDEGAVVLFGADGHRRVARLSVLGQLVRELADDEITLESLVDELEAILGPVEGDDATSIVRAAVADLERDGLVSTSLSRATRA